MGFELSTQGRDEVPALWLVDRGATQIPHRGTHAPVFEHGSLRIFTDDQIDAYIELKFQEIYNFEHTPHPIEFEMYYSG